MKKKNQDVFTFRKGKRDDFPFWLKMQAIENEIMFNGVQAFMSEEITPEYKKLLKNQIKKADCSSENKYEFDFSEYISEEYYNEMLRIWDNIYIVSKDNIDIGFFDVRDFGSKEPLRITSWCVEPQFFCRKSEIFESFLKQKEFRKKRLTIFVDRIDLLNYWLKPYGFSRIEGDCLLRFERPATAG